MLLIIEKIERYVVYILVFLLLISVVLGTIELCRVILNRIIIAPRFLVDVNTLFDSFALFLVIVVGLELLKSIKSYLVHGAINPAFVIEVAIIALGNKLITLDIKHTDYKILISIATILLGLSVTYFVLKKSGHQ
ncbi:MAG: phosphate-starvation-inducible PsiE family protein [Gammaproteobacteria bacterium]